jgi:hypothetical protein
MMTAWPIPDPGAPLSADVPDHVPEIERCECGGPCWWDDDAEVWHCALCPLTYEPNDDPGLEYVPAEPGGDLPSTERTRTMRQESRKTERRWRLWAHD